MRKDQFEIYKQPRLQNPSLIIGWSEDIGQLGPKVIDFLIKKLGGEKFGHIEPADFFTMGGVAIKSDTIHFPESESYSCEDRNLVIFRSDAPSYEWYRFLNLVLDIAEHYCGVKELYTIGGMASLTSHTHHRRILTVVNQPELKEMLSGYGLTTNMNYRTPPVGRPTISSFLLWAAKRRNIGGVNLWEEIPFYLAQEEDPRAWKTMIEFFDKRFNLALNLDEIDQRIEEQEQRINQLRIAKPEIDECLAKLERGGELTQTESEKLVKEIDDLLKKS